jgi:hypothetical protein
MTSPCDAARTTYKEMDKSPDARLSVPNAMQLCRTRLDAHSKQRALPSHVPTPRTCKSPGHIIARDY